MRIAVFDADLVGRKKHRFPNLVCMKLSSWHKKQGDDVELETHWEMFPTYDKVYVSKVFTDTPVDNYYLNLPNVEKGGTGFFFDKAPALPYEIEHSMPDYHLYDEWLRWKKRNGATMKCYEAYTDYSIGFLTRGCFRHCNFCVNRNYDRVVLHSPLSEFLDPTRKIVIPYDDNFLGCPEWRKPLTDLLNCKKKFCFKQGLDARLLTDEMCEMLFSTRKYYQDYIFAFDNIGDEPIITRKLQLIRKHTTRTNIKFFLFTGFDRADKYDDDFWRQDIADLFTRLKILAKYGMKPYMTKYKAIGESKFFRMYQFLSMWINQPRMYFHLSLEEFNETMKKTHSEGNINSRDYEELRQWLPKDVEKLHMRDLLDCQADAPDEELSDDDDM